MVIIQNLRGLFLKLYQQVKNVCFKLCGNIYVQGGQLFIHLELEEDGCFGFTSSFKTFRKGEDFFVADIEGPSSLFYILQRNLEGLYIINLLLVT